MNSETYILCSHSLNQSFMKSALFLFEFDVYFRDEFFEIIPNSKKTYFVKRCNYNNALNYLCKKIHSKNSKYNSFFIELNNKTLIN